MFGRKNDMPFRTDGKINTSITHNMLFQLPISWRGYWHRLDLDYIFAESEPEPPKLPELDEDRKTKLKAIALGELREQNNDYPESRDDVNF